MSLLLALCASASAQGSAANQADQLFVAGKAKLAEKDYAQACQLFSESFRVESATGTLLALAICQERAGKLASAFASYGDVAARSDKEQRPDRAKAASEKAAALKPRLSALQLDLGPKAGAAGLVVRLDGEVMAAAKLGSAIPLDGGSHTLEVSAPGVRSWTGTILLAESGDQKTLIVPLLESAATNASDTRAAAPPTAAAVAAEPEARKTSAVAVVASTPPTPEAAAPEAVPETADPTPSDTADSSSGDASGLSTVQAAGLVVLSAGLIGLGTGTFFTLRAVHDNDASRSGCNGDVCTAAARNQRLDARQAGNIATVSVVLGGGLAATGVLMWLLGGRPASASSSGDARSTGLALSPWFGAHGLGAVAEGAF